jgi:hypothetical protein
MWYNKQVRCQAGRESQSEAGSNKNRKIGERNFKENLKNLLTNF